ncbi:MAG: pyridoxal-phosphate-dependent aminotransferase family protein [Burkholderiaceae bacterium]
METVLPPSVISLDHILPDEPLLMMGAGPVPIPHKVAYANSIVINHLGETMNKVIEQVKEMGQYVFQTTSRHVLGVAGPGSAAMEMAIVNLVGPGTRMLAVCNGLFSGRMAEMATRVGATVTMAEVPYNETADPAMVEAYLKTGNFDVLTIVQGETSNTVWNRNVGAICQMAQTYGCMTIVDAVCTLSTMPLEMDLWKIDAVITGGQKGLSSIPGVSLVAFSDRAWEKIETRNFKITHWCLDAVLSNKFWNLKSYHYTAPVSGILALHEALRLVCDETLPSRFRRHEVCSKALQNGIEAMGIQLLVPERARLNSVLGVVIPDGISPDLVRSHMSKVHRVEVSGAFGQNMVRIGQMGEQSRAHNLFKTLHALGASLQSCGAKVDLPAGIAELEKGLSREIANSFA